MRSFTVADVADVAGFRDDSVYRSAKFMWCLSALSRTLLGRKADSLPSHYTGTHPMLQALYHVPQTLKRKPTPQSLNTTPQSLRRGYSCSFLLFLRSRLHRKPSLPHSVLHDRLGSRVIGHR